ncbi:hypothetical protein EVJ58_g7674 [Rhodofomes roseus]|uniref:Uncharacterized protein n=1 Tax=Rhodofomes roseus TaxID=34475 RepID=A0A4Y9Y480_9APHY|nr:hypothetical protein EVJ58_g7674 [Rhodofomes roseus]
MALDSPEYAARLRTPFAPPPPALSIKAVRAAVPRHLFQRSTRKCLFFVGRHVLLTALFALFAARIDDLVPVLLGLTGAEGGGRAEHALLWVMWATYWLWQSVAFMGLWTLGECFSACRLRKGKARHIGWQTSYASTRFPVITVSEQPRAYAPSRRVSMSSFACRCPVLVPPTDLR